MAALPAQRVEMVPIEQVTIVNPRIRNKRSFTEIVDNIAKLGLKKPITVTRRTEAGGPFYDLVCGQGRLEASKSRDRLSADALVKAYQDETDRKRALIRRAQATRDELLMITEALRRLSRDHRFVALLQEEELASLPQNLALRLQSHSEEAK